MLSQELQSVPKLVCIEAGFRSRSLAGRGSGHCGPMGEQYLGHGTLLSRPRPNLRLGLKKGVAQSRQERQRASFFFDCRPLRDSSRESIQQTPCHPVVVS